MAQAPATARSTDDASRDAGAIPARLASTQTLADLASGQKGIVVGIAETDETLKRRLTAFGIIRGTEITLDRTAPMGNPRSYCLLGYQLSLRNEDARSVLMRVG